MDINRFTEKLQEAIRAAQSLATRYGHQQLDVEHLFASLLEQEGGLAGSILSRAGVNVDTLRPRLEQELDRLPKVSGPSGAPDQIFDGPRPDLPPGWRRQRPDRLLRRAGLLSYCDYACARAVILFPGPTLLGNQTAGGVDRCPDPGHFDR